MATEISTVLVKLGTELVASLDLIGLEELKPLWKVAKDTELVLIYNTMIT